MKRDRNYEQDCLDHLIYKASMRGPGGDMFRRRVNIRLTEGGEEYGDDNFWEIGLDRVCLEAREEAEDIVSWLLGALQVARSLVQEGKLSQDAWNQMSLYMMEAAQTGLEAFQLLESARAIYRDAGGDDIENASKKSPQTA